MRGKRSEKPRAKRSAAPKQDMQTIGAADLHADHCLPNPRNNEAVPDLKVAQGPTPGFYQTPAEPGFGIPITEMGVIQLHALIRSRSGTPWYEKHHNLLDVYDRAELQRKVAEAMNG